jgi:iron complex outermembrane receptor protein
VYRYRQQDSRFEGLEAELGIPLGAGAFTLELTGEYLRGRLEGGGDLPRMPPFGLGAGLRYDEGAWSASLAVSHHFEQDRVADLVFRPGWLGDGVLLFLRGRNLLDEDARLHTSPLKDQLPLPGRSIGAGVRVEFGG